MEEKELQIGIDLSLASREVIEILLDDFSDPGVFGEVARENVNRPDILALILEHPYASEEAKAIASEKLNLPALQRSEIANVGARAEKTKEMRPESLMQKIQKLTVSQRIQLALRGGREIRGILVKDPNKEVSLSVLQNGKITETEVEMMAKNRFTLEEALRRIAKNKEWMKKYAVVFGLVTNPKTPPGIAVGLVNEIKVKDLDLLGKNKNVSEAVRSAAKRLLSVRKKH